MILSIKAKSHREQVPWFEGRVFFLSWLFFSSLQPTFPPTEEHRWKSSPGRATLSLKTTRNEMVTWPHVPPLRSAQVTFSFFKKRKPGSSIVFWSQFATSLPEAVCFLIRSTCIWVLLLLVSLHLYPPFLVRECTAGDAMWDLVLPSFPRNSSRCTGCTFHLRSYRLSAGKAAFR